jgi:hypothetical protein
MIDIVFIYPYKFRTYQLKRLEEIINTEEYINKRPYNKLKNEIKIVKEIIKQLENENKYHKFKLNMNINSILNKYAKIIGFRFADLIYYEILDQQR